MLEVVETRDDQAVIQEEACVFIDVIDDLLNCSDRVLQTVQARIGHTDGVVEELAHIAVQRLGDLDALPCAGRLRRAAQRVTGSMQIVGDRIRCVRKTAVRDELTNDGEMARGLFGVDFV